MNKKNPNRIGSKKGYKVGYKKPPKETQFKPGIGGGGHRPLGTVSLTLMIKKRLRELTPDGKREAIEMLADNIIQDALDSSDNMRKLIWNYIDGLPKQSIELEGKGEIPIRVISIKKYEPKRVHRRG